MADPEQPERGPKSRAALAAAGEVQRVSVFRNELLLPSETFVAEQARALRHFTASFAGLRPVPGGIPLDPKTVVTLTCADALADKLHRRFFLQTGFAPLFFRAIRDQRPALLHAHFAVDAATVLPLQKWLDIPLVVSLHGYDIMSTDEALGGFAPGRAYLRRKAELCARASLFLCVSEHIRSKALERGFPEAKLRTQAIGVDLEGFHADPGIAREPIVLFVGRLVEKKGCTHLIRAMAIVQERHPEAELVIVGEGPLREQLQTQADASLRHCTFTGSLPSSAVRSLMRRASVLAAPSIIAASGDTEGLPIVLCEAQATSLAIAGFRGPGTSEAVIEDETARLVESGDHRALAESISVLLADPVLASRLGAAGRRRVERFFSLATQTALLEKTYLEVLR
jgi:glycosyltransferase involved in cell wall biosynthesis